jgi:ABC-type transport system substrate-binding protein
MPQHVSSKIWLAIGLMTVTALGGCTPEPPPSPEVLRISYAEDPETLNPVTSGDLAAGDFQSFVYEPLAARDMADPDKLIPCLAEKWEFDESRLEYTIHLRRGVKWHPIALPDGTPLPDHEVTTRDVRFTFDCLLNPHLSSSSRSRFENPDADDEADRYNIHLETIDEYTFKVRWKKPFFLADESTLMVAIIPRHVFSVDKHGDLISLDFSSEEFAEGMSRHCEGEVKRRCLVPGSS